MGENISFKVHLSLSIAYLVFLLSPIFLLGDYTYRLFPELTQRT